MIYRLPESGLLVLDGHVGASRALVLTANVVLRMSESVRNTTSLQL